MISKARKKAGYFYGVRPYAVLIWIVPSDRDGITKYQFEKAALVVEYPSGSDSYRLPVGIRYALQELDESKGR